jgi:hypothetical protein
MLDLQGCSGLDLLCHFTDNFKNSLHLLSNGNTSDFDAWVSLISSAEETSAVSEMFLPWLCLGFG